MALKIIFWIFLFLIFYTYIGYGILLFLMVKIKTIIRGKKLRDIISDKDLPNVTLFIAAYNEQDVLEAKCNNSLNLDYPSDKLTILWVTDGSDDNTVNLLANKIKERGDILPKLRNEHSPLRKGKSAAFSRGIDYIDSDIVIFTDANTMLNKEAIKEIVYCFADPIVGCVAGEKRVSANMNYKGDYITGNEESAVATEGVYWKYESKLKEWDWQLNSAIGAAGELFAIRKNLFEDLPSNVLLDDFILSMRIVMNGYKIAYCKDAYAIEGTSANIEEEGKRKVRIAAGGLQSIYMLLPLLNIFKYGLFSFQYISHRVLRWTITPFLMIAVFVMNLFLLNQLLYQIVFVGQILFYLSGIIGWYLNSKGKKNKLFYIIYYFLFMNVNVFRGIFYLKRKKDGVWAKAKRK